TVVSGLVPFRGGGGGGGGVFAMAPFALSRDEVRGLGRRAIDGFGVPGVVLMENAGRGCAELLMRLNPDKKPVVILCGPGNNGGDGFVIARHLDNHGWPAKAWLFAPARATQTPEGWVVGEPKLPPDAAVNFRVWQRDRDVPIVEQD